MRFREKLVGGVLCPHGARLRWAVRLERRAETMVEYLLGVYLGLHHVWMDVHIHPCVLAQFDQGLDVVLGQTQVPSREGRER